jgi:hypothetical protein
MTLSNLLVTLLALLALMLARHGLRISARRSDVARRLRTLLALVAALLLCRLISAAAEGTVLTALTMSLAAWLPLSALRLVEELTRRHAARGVKLLALGGALAFTVVALTVGLVWSTGVVVALAAFQMAMLLLMVHQLVTSRAELSAADQEAATAILVALLLAVPLVLTDFRAIFPDLPVRGGPFAIILLVLASSSASVEGYAVRRFAMDVTLMVLAGAVATAAAEAAGTAPSLGLAAPIAALAGLLILVERFGRQPAGRAGLVAALARSSADSREALLALHPILANGRLLGSADLADYPAASLAALLRNRVTGADDENEEVRALARELLLASRATHLVRLAAAPPTLLAVSAGELATPALIDELTVAARLLERVA